MGLPLVIIHLRLGFSSLNHPAGLENSHMASRKAPYGRPSGPPGSTAMGAGASSPRHGSEVAATPAPGPLRPCLWPLRWRWRSAHHRCPFSTIESPSSWLISNSKGDHIFSQQNKTWYTQRFLLQKPEPVFPTRWIPKKIDTFFGTAFLRSILEGGGADRIYTHPYVCILYIYIFIHIDIVIYTYIKLYI